MLRNKDFWGVESLSLLSADAVGIEAGVEVGAGVDVAGVSGCASTSSASSVASSLPLPLPLALPLAFALACGALALPFAASDVGTDPFSADFVSATIALKQN